MTGRAFWLSLLSFNAILAIQGCEGPPEEPAKIGLCTDCECEDWDGQKYYSTCRLTTESEPCSRFCVKCEADGVTPMPGIYTKHEAECELYSERNGCAVWCEDEKFRNKTTGMH